ncbi:MAG: exo-alpha-sialidase [bacterium]|nr:exo-alpha-sialidase [bacterium]
MEHRFTVEKIWSQAQHNAFTDLIRFRRSWFCAFRESSGHIAMDGHVRIIRSDDGTHWLSAADIPCPEALQDLRDPRLSISSDGRLMLTAAAFRPLCQTFAFFSDDGVTWSAGSRIGPSGLWLWRTVWHEGYAYNFGRSELEQERFLQLFRSRDGVDFQPHGPRQFDGVYANETAPVFLADDTCLTLLRRDSDPPTAQLGTSQAPYDAWIWRDLGVRIGGPALMQLPDGRLLAVVRLYDEPRRTAVCWLDAEAATLTEFLTLPSRGDTSYAGLVLHQGVLWISYYSSDDDETRKRTSIYLARVDVAALE